MQYRAVLVGSKNGAIRVESIWVGTIEEAHSAGLSGIILYGAKNYIVEDTRGSVEKGRLLN